MEIKKTRIIFFCVIGILISAFIVGSFLDYQINDALFHHRDTFGLVVSVIGTTPGYGVFAFLGGGFLSLFFKKEEYKTPIRLLFLLGCLACLGSSTFFAGREFFGPNGFDFVVSQQACGFLISLPVMCGITYLGYLFIRKCENKYLWIILLILVAAFAIALTGGVTLFKEIFHRPRFRAIMNYGLEYHPWYKRCANYDEIAKALHIAKEEFKSFPSGHAASAMGLPMLMLFLPIFNKKFNKYLLPAFGASLAFALLVMFVRLYVGAHFLSDVAMGALLTTVFFYVTFEVMNHVKQLNVSISE